MCDNTNFNKWNFNLINNDYYLILPKSFNYINDSLIMTIKLICNFVNKMLKQEIMVSLTFFTPLIVITYIIWLGAMLIKKCLYAFFIATQKIQLRLIDRLR